MKFVCNNCMTQYLISDEKIGSKAVKVRCKRCGNVIIVRPGSSHSEENVAGAQAKASMQDGDPADDANISSKPADGDELGQAFDQLMKYGEDESADADQGEEGATQIFSKEDIDKLRGVQGDSELEKIDKAFSKMDSTEQPRNLATSGASDSSDWYVAIQDEQVGPMSLSELSKKWEASEINERTLSWRPGMKDWVAIKDAPDLCQLLEQPASGPSPTGNTEKTLVRKQEPMWNEDQGSALTSLVDREIVAATSAPPPAEPKQEEIHGDPPISSEEIPPWEREDVHSGEIAKPPESLFDSTLEKKPVDAGGGYFDDNYYRGGQGLAKPAYLGGTKSGLSTKNIVLIGTIAFVVVVGGIATFLLLKPGSSNGSTSDTPLVEIKKNDGEAKAATGVGGSQDPKNPDKESNLAKGADGGDNAASGSVDKDKESVNQGQVGESGKGPEAGKEGTGPREVVVAKRVEGGKTPGDRGTTNPDKGKIPKGPNVQIVKKDQKIPEGGKVPPPEKTPPSDGEGVMDGMTKDVVKATLGKAVGQMKGCVAQQQQRDPNVKGTMKISFTIENDGKVKTVTVLTDEHKGTYVASCISYIVTSLRFPKFKGVPFTVPSFPLTLGE